MRFSDDRSTGRTTLQSAGTAGIPTDGRRLSLRARALRSTDRGTAVEATRHLLRDLWDEHASHETARVHQMADADARVSPAQPEAAAPAATDEAPQVHEALNISPEVVAAVQARVGFVVGPLDVVAYAAAIAGRVGAVELEGDELVTLGVRAPITSDPVLWARATEVGREVLWASSYGVLAADPAAGRPQGTIGFPQGDARRPRQTARVEAVPSGLAYDRETRTLCVGTGRWSSIDPAVATYRVGARNVLSSWFAWRTMHPEGAVVDPLAPGTWPEAWSDELHDLLVVLTRLVSLDEPRLDVLAAILAGPVATAPVTAPAPAPARAPEARAAQAPAVRRRDPLALFPDAAFGF